MIRKVEVEKEDVSGCYASQNGETTDHDGQTDETNVGTRTVARQPAFIQP